VPEGLAGTQPLVRVVCQQPEHIQQGLLRRGTWAAVQHLYGHAALHCVGMNEQNQR
jgi:hypothetical protein